MRLTNTNITSITRRQAADKRGQPTWESAATVSIPALLVPLRSREKASLAARSIQADCRITIYEAAFDCEVGDRVTTAEGAFEMIEMEKAVHPTLGYRAYAAREIDV